MICQRFTSAWAMHHTVKSIKVRESGLARGHGPRQFNLGLAARGNGTVLSTGKVAQLAFASFPPGREIHSVTACLDCVTVADAASVDALPENRRYRFQSLFADLRPAAPSFPRSPIRHRWMMGR